MDSCCCDKVIMRVTMAVCVSDMIGYRHHHLTLPTVTPADRILYGLHLLTSTLHNVPTARSNTQLQAIGKLGDICHQWQATKPAPKSASNPIENPNEATVPTPVASSSVRHSPQLQGQVPKPSLSQETQVHEAVPQLAPRVVTFDPPPAAMLPAPRVAIEIPRPHEPIPIARRMRSATPSASAPISSRTRSKQAPTLSERALLSDALQVTPSKATQRKYPPHLLALWCTPVDEITCPVYDQDSGDTLEYRQLRHHPQYCDIWEASYANELGRLCQGVGTGTKGVKKQQVEGTDTYRLIKFNDIPQA